MYDLVPPSMKAQFNLINLPNQSIKLSVFINNETAKKKGLNITCDTAPPYFLLNETSLLTYDTSFKLSPPLRADEDRLAIIEGIQDFLPKL